MIGLGLSRLGKQSQGSRAFGDTLFISGEFHVHGDNDVDF